MGKSMRRLKEVSVEASLFDCVLYANLVASGRNSPPHLSVMRKTFEILNHESRDNFVIWLVLVRKQGEKSQFEATRSALQ